MIGVFLGDENLWDGTSLENLTTVVDMIKTDWPDAITFINEAQDTVNCGFNRLNETIFAPGECMPENLDIFGYDYYCTIPGCTDAYGKEAGWNVQRDGMVNMLYPRLAPHQRVIPTTLGFFYTGLPPPGMNASMLATMDEYCAYTAQQYFEWALEDPRVAGLFPFYWHDSAGTVGLGTNLTKCRAAYEAWGKLVIAGGVPPATMPHRQFRAPTPGRVCPTPTEKIQHSWCGTHH